MKAINAYNDGDDIVFVIHDQLGKRLERVRNFEWYFYIDGSFRDTFKKDPDFSARFKAAHGITRLESEHPYIKAYTKYSLTKIRKGNKYKPGEFREWTNDKYFQELAQMGVSTFEADVNPLKRLMIDSNEYEVSDEYRILFLDIETDDRKPEGAATNEIVIGERQIISLAGYESPAVNFVYDSIIDEVEIIRKFFKKMKDYDVLIGWNSDAFDIPYIKSRVQHFRDTLGIDLEREFDIDWRNFIVVDLMWRFKHVYQGNATLTSFSLKKVSEYFKIGSKTDLNRRSIWEVFANDPALGREYNLNDAKLLYDLEEKIGVFKQMIAQARFCKTFLSQFWITELLDNLVLQYGRARRIHLPTKFWTPKSDESYAGGYVLDPKPGFYLNINIFDYGSLYPNIIRTFNISPDTMLHEDNGNCIKGLKSGIYFDKTLRDPNDPDSYLGLLPRVVKSLLDSRDSFKKKKAQLTLEGKTESIEFQSADRDEMIVKELNNAVYGTCGNERSRYYSIDLAESITLAGQHLIKFARDFFEGIGFTVCAGDTDSIMVSLPEGSDPTAIMEMYHTALNAHLRADFGALDCHIKFKHEKKFSRFINITKKNYVGRVSEEGGKPVDRIHARGLELIKKDTLAFTRVQLKQMNQWLLYEDHSQDFYVKYVENLRNEVHTQDFKVEEICAIKKVSKAFSEYKTTPPAHVLLAKKMADAGDKDFFLGMDLQYFIRDSTDKGNKAEFIANYTGQFDRIFFWENQVYPPIERILSVVYPNHDWKQYENSTIQRPKKPRAKKKKKDAEAVDEGAAEMVHASVSEAPEQGF